MADLNARIKPKKSSTTGEVPQAADLEVAEIAVNTADGKLFVKHTDNSIKEISGTGGGGAVDSVNGQTGVVDLALEDMNNVLQSVAPDLLLHFDGTDGSTTITDSGAHGLPTQTVAGVEITTADKKFGTGSFNPTASGFGGGYARYSTSNTQAHFDLGAQDWSIDFWFKVVGGVSNGTIVSIPNTVAFKVYATSTTCGIGAVAWEGASTTSYGPNADVSGVGTDWNHYAISRQGNTVYTFVNGTAGSTFDWTGVTLDPVTKRLGINNKGTDLSPEGGEYTDGLDELRIVVGTALFTQPFTPPTAPYSSGATDGQVLTWVDANSQWEPVNAAGGAVDSVNGDTGVVVVDLDSATSQGATTNNDLSVGDLLTVQGDGAAQDGRLKLNCSANTHGVTIQSPPHSDAASYTLTLPSSAGIAGQVLTSQGGSQLTWEDAGGGAAAINDLADVDTTTTLPTDGQVLTWVDANSQWEANDPYLGGTTQDLDDVSVSAPTSGQILAFDVPVPITSNTKLYIDFNNQLVDGSGSTHTVTESSAHSFAADVPPGSSATHSILFPVSSSSRVLVADSPDFNWGSGDFTFEAWVKGTVVESGEGVYLASQRNTYSNQNGWLFGLSTESSIPKLYFGQGIGTSANNFYSDSLIGHLSNNTWQHYAVVRSGNTLTFYLDGIARGTASITGPCFDSAKDLMIGSIHSASPVARSANNSYQLHDLTLTSSARYLSNFTPKPDTFGSSNVYEPIDLTLGVISDVDTTTTPPTDGQVLTWVDANSQWEPVAPVSTLSDLSDVETTGVADGEALTYVVNPDIPPSGEFVVTAAGGTISDVSANALTITNNNSVGVANDGVTGDCLDFSTGASANLSVADDPALNLFGTDFTIEFSFKYTTGGSSAYIIPFSKRTANASANRDYTCVLQSDTGNIVFELSNGTNTTAFSAAFGTRTEGVWYHVAFVLNGTDVAIYKDGTKINGASSYASFLNQTSSPLRLGSNESGSSGDFKMDNFRISKSALYTTSFTPPTDFPTTPGAIQWEPVGYISKATLQTEVAAATDFADFQARIAAL